MGNEQTQTEGEKVSTEQPKRTCRNCIYIRPEPVKENVKAEIGRCWRYPPRLFLVQQGQISLRTVVGYDDFCGEFRLDPTKAGAATRAEFSGRKVLDIRDLKMKEGEK